MKRFRLIEHTADTGLIACGSDLAEAYANAAYGLFSIMVEINKVRLVEAQAISVNGEDAESLLFNWLNHLIYVFDVQHYLFKRFDIMEFDEHNLRVTGWGEKYNPERHHLKLGVKSATYHLLEVDRAKNRVQVIFDV